MSPCSHDLYDELYELHNLFFQHHSKVIGWKVVTSTCLGLNFQEPAYASDLKLSESVFINKNVDMVSMDTTG